jgi:hypothetical protein
LFITTNNDYGQNYSEGTWSNNAMFIILKSFEKYIPTLEDIAKEKDPLYLTLINQEILLKRILTTSVLISGMTL